MFVVRWSVFVVRWSVFVVLWSVFVVLWSVFVVLWSVFVVLWSVFVVKRSTSNNDMSEMPILAISWVKMVKMEVPKFFIVVLVFS